MASTQIQQIGHYQIRAEIRRDPFSITYQALDTQSKQQFSLRVLDAELASEPTVVQRFIQAGQEAARLQHPNIVQIYEARESDGHPYITGELVNGKTLLSLLIQRNKLLTPNEVTSIVQQIAAALDYAHEQGLLHLDLNFRHIILNEEGQALLADLGMSGFRQSSAATERLVDISVFTAPEQARGAYNIDYRADLYSLGVIVYAMLVGKLPFEAEDTATLQQQILEQTPPPPDSINPRIPEAVVYVLNKALAKEPPQRYNSAGEFATELIRSLFWVSDGEAAGLLDAADEENAAEKQLRRRRGWLISTVSVALLILALLTFGALYARPTLMNQLTMLGLGNKPDAPITTTQALATPIQAVLAATVTQTTPVVIAQQNPITSSEAQTNTVPPTAAVQANGVVTAAQASTITVATPPLTPTMTQQATPAPATSVPTVTPTLVTQAAAVKGADTAITPTLTLAATATATVAPTNTSVPTATPLPTNPPAPTATPTVAPTNTNSPAPTATSKPTDTLTPVPPATNTVAPTATPLPTVTPTVIIVPTTTATPVPTVTPTRAPTNTNTPLPTSTNTPLPTVTPTLTPTNTNTPAPTATPTIAPTNTNTPLPTAPPTLIPTNTNTPAPTATPTIAPTNTNTPLPAVPPTLIPTNTSTPAPTTTPTIAPTNTNTPLPTASPTLVPTNTSTLAPTATPTIAPTNTPKPTDTATALPTATVTNPPTPTSTSLVATATAVAPITTTAGVSGAIASQVNITSSVTLTNPATATTLPTATPTTIPPTATPTKTPVPPTATQAPTATPIPIPPSFDATALRNPLNDGVARLRGVGQPGYTVQVLVDGKVAGTTAIRANGAWGLNVNLGGPGSYQITVRALNANGKIIQSAMRPATATVPAPTPVPTPTTAIGAVQLVAPGEGTASSGSVDFQWSTNFTPGPGMGFELVLWKDGQNPMTNGFGLAAPTKGTKVSVDLGALDNKLGDLLDPGSYKWGILLVRVSPYERVQFMGQARTIRYDRGGGDGGGGGGSSSGGGQKSGE